MLIRPATCCDPIGADRTIARVPTNRSRMVGDTFSVPTHLAAARGVAVREFILKPPHGRADYLLFVDRQAVRSIEAKPTGTTLIGVEIQSAKYHDGLPDLDIPVRPLPFAYESTGVESRFTNRVDPEPRSRAVFSFHQPSTPAGWIREIKERPAASTLRHRLRAMPPLNGSGLWPAQARAIENLEPSLREDRPRALIQMATGAPPPMPDKVPAHKRDNDRSHDEWRSQLCTNDRPRNVATA
jgi:type I restriction enzyme R subunit